MTKEMGPSLVAAAFETLCEGTSADRAAPLRTKPGHAVVTVFKDGSREVGCGYLSMQDATCRSTENKAQCILLFPGTQDMQQAEEPIQNATVEESQREHYGGVQRAVRRRIEQVPSGEPPALPN